jgi:hypothetical protein
MLGQERDLDGHNHIPFTPNILPDIEAVAPKSWPPQWHSSGAFEHPQLVGDDLFNRVLEDGMSYAPYESQFRLGESHLPIAPYREHIVDTVMNNQRVVLSSETGSGKSSQIGLYLLEAGFPRVFVSSPRILAARELKDRARENLGPDLAELAGYLTGNAADSDCPPSARLIYVTEKLLFKMINRGQIAPDDVIVNDEAHERTSGTVLLLGLMKRILVQNPDMRLLISSATIDTGKFARYLADPKTGTPAPVLELPGRVFPVGWSESPLDVAAAARRAMRRGKNVLAFEPGKARLQETWVHMQNNNASESVHQLHGDLSPTEQKLALNPGDHHHIVSTRIGETSITPLGKNAVVDSGLSNLGGYSQGVRELITDFSSKATIIQRRGRVGRVSEGEYTLATPTGTPPPPAFEDREEYDPPDIQGSSVASYIAELMYAGIRLEDLDLFESPTYENLRHDYKVLRRIGAVAVIGDEYLLTEIGRSIIDLPLDTNLARMVVESRNLGDELRMEDVRVQVAAAAAVQQVYGVINKWQYSKQRYQQKKSHAGIMSTEERSDMLFELDLFIDIFQRGQQFAEEDPEHAVHLLEMFMNKKDISPNKYYKALMSLEEICRREGLDVSVLRKPVLEERMAIIACQISGADELFVQGGRYVHRDIRGDKNRRLGQRSCIASQLARLVVGTAFDRIGLRESGRYVRRYITGASAITTEQLLAYAPDRITRQGVGFGLKRNGQFAERQTLFFDGELPFDQISAELPPTIESREFILRAMMTGLVASYDRPQDTVPYHAGTPNAKHSVRQYRYAQEFAHRSPVDMMVRSRMDKLVRKAVEQSMRYPLDVVDPAVLDVAIPRVFLTSLIRAKQKKNIPKILQQSPDAIRIKLDQNNKMYLPVTYRNGIAYITVPPEIMYDLNPADFEGLRKDHDIKLQTPRVGNSKYKQIDDFFEEIEQRKVSRKHVLRRKRREEEDAVSVPYEKARQLILRKNNVQVMKSLKATEASETPEVKRPNKKPRGGRNKKVVAS